MTPEFQPGNTVICINAAPHGGGLRATLRHGMFYQVESSGLNFGGWQGEWVRVRGVKAYWNATRFSKLPDVVAWPTPRTRVSLPMQEPA
jgi:hypothetical protein